MENDRIANRFSVGECASSRTVGRLLKRWIDTVKDCLKKRALYVRQGRRSVVRVCKEKCRGCRLEDFDKMALTIFQFASNIL